MADLKPNPFLKFVFPKIMAPFPTLAGEPETSVDRFTREVFGIPRHDPIVDVQPMTGPVGTINFYLPSDPLTPLQAPKTGRQRKR